LGTYEDIAQEYYDPIRHPTCANFYEASVYLISKWLKQLHVNNGWLCEVGPGKSLLAEKLYRQNMALDQLILVDSSPSMLAYSNQWTSRGAKLIRCDALKLPFVSGSLELLVSSLGDPYNEYNECSFWDEVYRVLRPGGISLFTTPSFDWASEYRDEGYMMQAEFKLVDGRKVLVPSLIYHNDKQLKIFRDSGLLVKEVTLVSRSTLMSEHISPKLLIGENDKCIVTGYVLIKANEN